MNLLSYLFFESRNSRGGVFRRNFRVSLPPLVTVLLHLVFMLSEESFVWWTSLCSFSCLPVFPTRRHHPRQIRCRVCITPLFPHLACRDLQSNSESWLHNPPIRVQSNGLGARWTDHHPTTLIIRSCTSNQWIQQLYSVHESWRWPYL